MKVLVVSNGDLQAKRRWDIDFHLPAVGITAYASEILQPVSACADVIKTKRDPTREPDRAFWYVDISSVEVETGVIVNPQELTGQEAPSRARKEIHAYDIIISTCRPTRGAIAVVPEHLHGQICSTGFSVIRPHRDINAFYLHFALRLPSTLEQLRKWSTGSSYPAILDEDVEKTLIPLPEAHTQDSIAKVLRVASNERDRIIATATQAWKETVAEVVSHLERNSHVEHREAPDDVIFSSGQIRQRIAGLPPVD